jgi:hypothetical protein
LAAPPQQNRRDQELLLSRSSASASAALSAPAPSLLRSGVVHRRGQLARLRHGEKVAQLTLPHHRVTGLDAACSAMSTRQPSPAAR